MSRTNAAAAQLEAVAVAVAIAFAKFCKAVPECNAVLNGNNTNRTCCSFCKQIPAVIAVVVCHTAVKYVAFAAGQLCSKTICIFHGGIVAVVLRSTIQNQVIARPICNGCSIGVIPRNL